MLRFPKIVIGAGTGAALFMLGIMSAYAEVGPQGVPGTDVARQLELIGKVLDTVRSHYVDKPDDGKLLTAAINGVLGVLDPHSSYMDEKAYRDMASTQLNGRMARPEEIAASALYLAADESSMVTGSSLLIDGGWSAGGFFRNF